MSTENEAIIDSEGKVNWEEVVKKGKANQPFSPEESDIVVSEFERIERETNEFLKRPEVKAALKQTHHPISFYMETYPPNNPSGTILAHASLTSKGFSVWSNYQSTNITTEEALRYAMRGLNPDLNHFIDGLKEAIDAIPNPKKTTKSS